MPDLSTGAAEDGTVFIETATDGSSLTTKSTCQNYIDALASYSGAAKTCEYTWLDASGNPTAVQGDAKGGQWAIKALKNQGRSHVKSLSLIGNSDVGSATPSLKTPIDTATTGNILKGNFILKVKDLKTP